MGDRVDKGGCDEKKSRVPKSSRRARTDLIAYFFNGIDIDRK